MRVLARPIGMSLALVSGWLAPQVAHAQAATEAYPAQPGYQYPQQYQQPQAQPQPYPQQYQQPQPYQYPQQYQQPQPTQPGQNQQPQPAQPGQYQPPQPYPQQYQQPQAYPQQYQPPGTYPQPGQPQAYPPQYPQTYPQPAYPQQPGYQPQPAYPAVPVAAEPTYQPRHRGFMAMPYFGFNFPVGDASDVYSTGVRLGGLMGGYLGSHFSLNGELSIDIMNPDADFTEVLLALSLSPLFHFGPPRLDFVIGPRLGYYVDSMTVSSDGTDYTQTYKGLAYGFNGGAFVQLGRIWLGGLLSFTLHDPSEYCYSRSGYDEQCDDVDGDAFKVLTLNGAILF